MILVDIHTYIDKGCGCGRTIQWNHLQNLVRTLVCCRRLRQETMLVVDEETHEEKGIALKSGRHDSATCHRFKSCEMVWHCAVQHGSAKQLGSIKVLWIQKSKPLLTCLPGTRHVEIPCGNSMWKFHENSKRNRWNEVCSRKRALWCRPKTTKGSVSASAGIPSSCGNLNPGPGDPWQSKTLRCEVFCF